MRAKFLDLARELGALGVWVRLHYVYPYPHVDEVIPLMAEGKVLPYLDIPFQHASPAVLKAMRRPAHQEKTLERIRRWREICPDLAIRSTFIVGFPGETEEDFEMLLDWLKRGEARPRRLLQIRAGQRRAGQRPRPPPVPDEVKEERWHRFMEAQQEISATQLADEGRQAAAGASSTRPGRRSRRAARNATRRRSTAPCTSQSRRPLRAGEIVTVKIERADAYDLHGMAV